MKQAWRVMLVLVLAGCSGQRPSQQAAQNAAQVSSQSASAAGPNFNVNVSVSDAARNTLAQRKETVIVAAWISGNPKHGAAKKFINDIGMIELFDRQFEMTTPGGTASFTDIKLPADRVSQTDGKDYELLINVFSGRRSSKDNLLDCGFYDGSLKAVQGQAIDIKCKLIAEKS